MSSISRASALKRRLVGVGKRLSRIHFSVACEAKGFTILESTRPTLSASPEMSALKSRLDNNLQSQLHHVSMNIADFAVVPPGDHAVSVFNHYVAVAADALSMKRRLGQTTLTFPFFSFAGQEPVANQSSKKRRAQ